MENISLLFIAPLPPPTTGQSLASAALFNDLKSRGIAVFLVNMNKGTFRQGVSSFGRIFEVGWRLFRVVRFAPRASMIYLTPAESVAGNLKDLLIMVILGFRLRNTYLHVHGGAGMRVLLSEKHPLLLKINAWFLRRVAGVIVLGDRHVDIYERLMPRQRIHVVKNFSPDEFFVSDEELANKWQSPYKIRVLFLSNLLPGKGYEELAQAIVRLPPDLMEKYRFDFAGGFESAQAEQAFLTSVKHLPNVTYHGSVHGDEKRELLRQAHLFCLPTYYPYEGQPISILEAYAAGCAVATTDHSGIFDIFTPCENGWEVIPRSVPALIEMLLKVASNPQAAARIGKANSGLARSLYRQESHLAALRTALGLGSA